MVQRSHQDTTDLPQEGLQGARKVSYLSPLATLTKSTDVHTRPNVVRILGTIPKLLQLIPAGHPTRNRRNPRPTTWFVVTSSGYAIA